jgi:DNA-binding GntR family transcriptional regulator
MTEETTVSLAERAYQRLRREILHGDLMPGERLRAADLQDRFQLGLTPIREALMRLTTENLVEAEMHRGSRVTAASLDELADLMETRRRIERECLTLSIERGDEHWEAEIVASMHVLSRTALPSSPQDRAAATQWEAHHRRFHFSLIRSCGSDWLLKFWNMLADHSERYRKVRLLHHRDADAKVRDVNAEHAAIMKAVLKRDAENATRLMDLHLSATEKTVAKLLMQAQTQRTPTK